MAKRAPKPMPLLLRRRKDGQLYLRSDDFPPDHEFSTGWLLRHMGPQTVFVDEQESYVDDDGNIQRRIVQAPARDDNGNQIVTPQVAFKEADGDGNEVIVLRLANGTATYKVDHVRNAETKSTGVWATLVSSERK